MISSKQFSTPGIGGDIEFGMFFLLWAKSFKGKLTAKSIMNHFQCSKGTAYRWLRSFESVTDMYA